MQMHQEGMVLAWRGGAKTTYCNVATCLTELIRDGNIRICIASNGLDQSKTILRQVKSHIEDNEKFIRIFGDLKSGGKVWTESEITINTRTSHAGEPTVYSGDEHSQSISLTRYMHGVLHLEFGLLETSCISSIRCTKLLNTYDEEFVDVKPIFL